jgi:hypothetical protein
MQFAASCDLSAASCDALFRVFRQIDTRLYGASAQVVWRHFLGSSFAVSLL